MPDFAEHPELMGEEGFCIDALISPERSVTTYLHSLIEFPEALQVVEFADGRISVVTVRVGHGSPMAHHPVAQLREVWPDVAARVVDVVRDGRPLQASRGTVIALTAAGRAAIEETLPAHLATEQAILSTLDPAERAQLAALLRRVREAAVAP